MYKEGRKTIYETGDLVGPYNIEFIKEVEPYISPKGVKSRKGIFRCPVCQNTWESAISSIKSGKTKSCCGNKRKYYKTGELIGPHHIKFIEEAEDHIYKTNTGYKRQGKFECPKCHKIFICTYSDMLSGRVSSCGCYQKTYHIKYNNGDFVGPNKILLKQRLNNKGNPEGIFICPKCQKEYRAQIGTVVRGKWKQNCPNCTSFVKDFSGVKIGKMTVLEPTDQRTSYGVTIWKCLCDCGNIFYTNSSCISKKNVSSCGCLTKSYGEELIEQLLKQQNIIYNMQHKFSDCKNIKPLPFDFYLPNYNICIEYDGEQHYKIIDYWGGEEGFKQRQNNDEIKNQYCKDNNIKLIRIPYWDYDKLDEEYLLSLIEG